MQCHHQRRSLYNLSHKGCFNFNFKSIKLRANLIIESTRSLILRSNMASNTATDLPPEAIAFATRMYDAARAGQLNIFQQALPAGLPANMTNEKGDSLVR